MKPKLRIITVFICLALLIIIVPKKLNQLHGSPPVSVKDTLSSSQLSYYGQIGVGASAGDTILKVGSSTNPPSPDTNNLFIGDTVAIGTGVSNGWLTKYTVSDVATTMVFQINAGIGASNIAFGNAIIATRSAIHTISFTPTDTVSGNAWQFLIKASTRTGEVYNDGIPDQQGFDLGQDVGSTTTGLGTRLKTADVSCPWGSTAGGVGTTAIVNSNTYWVITCTVGAGLTNPINVGATVTIGRALTSGSQLINPSAASTHTEGQADVYSFYIRHTDNSGATIYTNDTIQGKIGVVEAVRVTATVDPTLTFTIDTGTSANTVGATLCGQDMGSNATLTTGEVVNFGSIILGQMNDLAQRLNANTNANGGYTVTVYESGVMSGIGITTTGGVAITIPDTTCDIGSTCSTTVAGNWVADTGSSGSKWGYSIQNVNMGTTIFTSGAGTSFVAKPFGIGYANAQPVMSNTARPSTTEQAYMCYRITAANAQAAGNYQTSLIYTATATF